MLNLKHAAPLPAGPQAAPPDLHLVGPADVGARSPLTLARYGGAAIPARRPAVEAPPTFASAAAMVRERRPDHPVLCVRPDELRRRARTFLEGFGGHPLYAVKCNPDPFVLATLFEAGITGFDVASLEEVRQIDALFGGGASLFFNNPAKSRDAIRSSARHHGVRVFTVDHPSELDKLIHETRGHDGEIVVAVRLAVQTDAARYALSSKFGAPPGVAADLLRAAARAGLRAGLSFHVGSQCLDSGAFVQALLLCREVVRAAGASLDHLNVGGGFPAPYPGDAVAGLDAYFEAVELGRRSLGLPSDCLILCEPGRALVSTAISVVTQVLLRRDDVLYCNDGIYGNLQELRSARERRPARLIRPDGAVEIGAHAFRVYGPTCDCDDVLGAPVHLPGDVAEGDWIELGLMGAYGSATRTPFNGFTAHATVQVTG